MKSGNEMSEVHLNLWCLMEQEKMRGWSQTKQDNQNVYTHLMMSSSKLST